MNHKRKGPKSTRAGCLHCKPHKREGQKLSVRLSPGQRRALERDTLKVAEGPDPWWWDDYED